MAKRFDRVYLADDAADFRPIAIEPGVPLLDSAGANDKIMFKWLGGLIAEPEWNDEGNSVNFFVRDDQGGRLEEVNVSLVDPQDLSTTLAPDVERIRERLAVAKATSGAEEMMLKVVRGLFNALLEEDMAINRPFFFFKYKDSNDNWRLLWAYGYQRSDEEIGRPVICDDEECSLLYVQRTGQPRRCIGCQALPFTRKKQRDRLKRRICWSIFLLLLMSLLGWVLFNAFLALKINPDPVTVPVGATVDFSVGTPGLFNLGLIMSEDLSPTAQAQVADTRVLNFADGLQAFAQSPGETDVTFFAKGRKKTIKVAVVPPVMPNKLRIEPAKAELGVGSTQKFKVWGEYDNGVTADLSQACVWNCKNDGTIYHFNGFVEGLAEGAANVVCRYRVSPKDAWLDATAEVAVAAESYDSLQMELSEKSIPLGQAAKIKVTAHTATGKTVSMTGSSLLDWSVTPPQVAQYKGDKLQSKSAGAGAVKVAMNGLSADVPFQVVAGSVIKGLKVSPEQVSMHVDELLPLSINAPSGNPVKITSKNLKVVGVDDSGRLIGRAAGKAQVLVQAGEEQKTVEVTVAEGKVSAIASFPPEIAVPLDHQVPIRIMALSSGGTYFQLAPERVSLNQKPSVRYMDIDGRLNIKGYEPTNGTNSLILNYRGVQTSAPVSVLAAPLRLSITPAGEVKLPLGLCMTFDGWAVYGDGVSCLVPYTRIAWQSEPTKADGFEFKSGKAMALKAGVGPIGVWGAYYGATSNRTELTTTERADVQLQLDVDRNIRIAGEKGRAIVRGFSPTLGDVELVPDIAQFSSSDEKVVKPMDPSSGMYNAAEIGKAALSVKHIAAEKPAAVDLQVIHGRNASLRWEKDSVKLAVDQTAEMKLFLDAKLGEDDAITSVEMISGAQFKVDRTDAVYWQYPLLTGQAAAEPFKLTAAFAPYLKSVAEATVEVSETNSPAELKITAQPTATNPAAGSSMMLAVEELMAGDSEFREVEPSVVSWDVPSGVLWTAPKPGVRPELKFPAEASGTYTIQARYAGKAASLGITLDKSALDPNDPEVEIAVKRYPPGIYVPQGSSQGYAIVLKKGDREELATNVQWSPNFEGEFVSWYAPVLTAEKVGYLQWLEAKVGKRAVRWYVQTVDLFAEGGKREAVEGQPVSVRLISDQGEEVSVPVGGKFDDFRVEAVYPGGVIKTVTKKSTFHAVSGDKKSSTPVNGKIEGLAVGTATYIAEYQAVDSEEKLKVNVTADVDIDTIKLTPKAGSRLLQNNGETVSFDAHGYKGDKSIGILTHFEGMAWQSSDPDKVGMQANVGTGKNVGSAQITATYKGVTSEPSTVDVVATIEEQLGPTERVIRMRVGESRMVGKDFAIIRGNTDFSKQCTVVSGNPGCVEYNQPLHALVGKTPGNSVITFLMGDKKATMTAIVKGISAEEMKEIQEQGEIVIEPAGATISAGQALEVRVYVVTPSGLKIDRTSSAILSSSDASTLEIQAFQACAKKPGQAVLKALVPELAGNKKVGAAEITIDGNPITELVVEPGAFPMSVGDSKPLFIQGRSAAGLYPLFAQPDLKVTSSAPIAEVQGIRTVIARQQGEATIDVNYKALNRQVPVTVTDDPYSDLRIDPPNPTIAKGEAMRFQVTAMRGGRLHVLTAADGLKFYTADPKIAVAIPKDMAVMGASEGRTTVIAEMGALKTDAAVTVAPPGVNGEYINSVAERGADAGYGTTIVGDGDVGTVVVGDGYGISDGTYGMGGVNQPEYIGDDGTYTGSLNDIGASVADIDPTRVSALQFVPETVRMGLSGSQPMEIRELLSDGSLGRDVSNDPNLVLSAVKPEVAQWQDNGSGGKVLVPVKSGSGTATATLGSLSTLSSLLVQVGDFAEGTGVVVVQPQSLDMWEGETAAIESVQISPDNGQMPFDISYRLVAADDSGVVGVDGTSIRALRQGTAMVRVETVDPSGPNDKKTSMVRVNVAPPQQFEVSPKVVSLQIGQSTSPFTVTAREPSTGNSYPVPAIWSVGDSSILEADPADPSRFRALSMGTTQVQANVRGRIVGEATVRISGERFQDVFSNGAPQESDSSFTVSLTAVGAAKGGSLEYRVYLQGQPSGSWVQAAAADGESQSATLVSPPIPYQARGSQYTLILESRTPGADDVQQYPFSFRLKSDVERVGQP